MNAIRGERARRAFGLLAFAVVYLVMGLIGFVDPRGAGTSRIVWFPAGLALGLLARFGVRLWPGVLLGSFGVSLWTRLPVSAGVALALASAVEAVLAAAAVRWWIRGDRPLCRSREVVVLAAIAAVTSVVASTAGMTAFEVAHVAVPAAQSSTWGRWWASHLVGDLVVAPAILIWSRPIQPDQRRRSPLEGAILGAVLLGSASLLLLYTPASEVVPTVLRPYLLFLPLIWGAARFGPCGGSLGTLIVALVAVLGTTSGYGAFVTPEGTRDILSMNVFLTSAALAVLGLGAIVAELERSRALLEESEERQRVAVEGARLGMWFWWPRRRSLEWSPLCREMHGFSREEPVTFESFRASIHPDDWPAIEESLGRGRPGQLDYRVEYRATRAGGAPRCIAALGCMHHNQAGDLERAFGITIDITASRQAEEERARLLDRLRAANAEAAAAARAKDDFLAVLSHELRTPLQSMLGWAQVLRTHPPGAATSRKALDTIERNVKTQAQLIEDLLDVSRITAGKLRLELQRARLSTVLEAALDSIKGAADSKSQRVEVRVEARACEVRGDPARLQQVFSNLLSNAVKFTPKGGVISVKLARRGPDVVVSVSDTGLGIAPEFLPHVFDRFRQADTAATTRSRGGLGLGLAIVHHLVGLHGGEVTAESEGLGKGARFEVSLPALEEGPHDEPCPPPGPPPEPCSLVATRILVVDDDEDTRDLLAAILRDAEAEVRTAVSVREALSLMESWTPDVLLSDIGMPEEDGYLLIRELRAREAARGGHVLAFASTAFASSADRELALSRGFDAHLAKPFEVRELMSLLCRR